MKSMQCAARRFRIEGAGWRLMGAEVIEQRARNGRFADAAFIRPDENNCWSCHDTAH
jgi:hypothetical protein